MRTLEPASFYHRDEHAFFISRLCSAVASEVTTNAAA